jgi:tRNA pseudouridine32 synthase/23S rRNA pseudouridine746 synthase
VLDYLRERFPHVGTGIWERRIERGMVAFADGERVEIETPYRGGSTVRYFREVDDEEIIPFAERVLHRDEHIVIADKPHFLPVVPTGPYVNECLLFRLRRATGIAGLTPVHRLDRETAGLLLFAADPATRPLYHRLFAEGAIEKEYRAVGKIEREIEGREWIIEERLVPGEPWFRMAIAPGEPNTRTRIILEERRDGHGLFRLFPATGKKHQLRVHMNALGAPIVNDSLYPDVWPQAPYDYRRPLQLLARRLAFRDPVSGRPMEFTSERTLLW